MENLPRPNYAKSRILIVDDNPANVELLQMMLNVAGYENIWTTTDSREVKSLYQQWRFDIILLDIRMPHLDGFQVMEQMAEVTSEDYLPILVLSAQSDLNTRNRALGAGAKDFITKPFDQIEMLNRVNNILEVRQLYNERRRQTEILEQRVQDRTRDLEQTHVEIIRRLARAGEYRDNETGLHVVRMSRYCYILGRAAGMDEKQADWLMHASTMHDVGKIGIPDGVLLKPGKLDDKEWEIMKEHTLIGARILDDSAHPLLKVAQTIALTHHEKWDGNGYPNQLKGDAIPIEGRICSLCDVFDALTSARPYKVAWSIEKALAFIQEQSGKHFDPRLAQIFLNIIPEILIVRNQNLDPPEETNAEAILRKRSPVPTLSNAI
ncbi:putative two-component system response regulator [Azospirillaceae bacterium]